MTTEIKLGKIKHPNALAICQGFELEEQATLLLNEFPATTDFIGKLLEQKLYPDAVRFLAHALPKREATWWACLCARNGLTDKTPAIQVKAIELAEAWVYNPADENSKLNYPVAEAAGHKNAASWAATAAFWSGNDISPIPEAVIPPDEKLYAKAVVGAVMLAATQGEASQVDDHYRLFLKQGLHIASGADGRNVE